LNDLELGQRKVSAADAIGWDLKDILEQRDRPTDQDGDPDWTVGQILKMTVPSVSHKKIGDDEHDDGDLHESKRIMASYEVNSKSPDS
jgi:hypothetical protein